MKKFFQAMSHPVSSNLSYSDFVDSSGMSASNSTSSSESDSYQLSESSVDDSDDSDS